MTAEQPRNWQGDVVEYRYPPFIPLDDTIVDEFDEMMPEIPQKAECPQGHGELTLVREGFEYEALPYAVYYIEVPQYECYPTGADKLAPSCETSYLPENVRQRLLVSVDKELARHNLQVGFNREAYSLAPKLQEG